MTAVTLQVDELRSLMAEATEIGFNRAFDSMVCYNYKDACLFLKISYNTLKQRILDGKIHAIDGRITGAELRRYLQTAKSPKKAPYH